MIGNFLLVALGGAAGAMARYAVSLTLAGVGGFPWATLIVNVAGGFAMGLLMGSALAGAKPMTLVLGTGFLGGFTTFSAFSIETVRLIGSGDGLAAMGNVAASVGLSVLACAAGLAMARGLA